MSAAETEQLDDGPLGRLALSRSTVDRATARRADGAWVEAAWADPRSRVLVVSDSQALVRSADGRPELVFISSAEAPEGTKFLLGVDADDVAYFGVSVPGGVSRVRSGEDDVQPMSLRQVGAVLSDRDAGLLTHAVALANWHDTHTHCPRDGTPTVPAPAGHLTTCPTDGSEHFPRLDPAVIMLVTDPDDRCLLARNALWPKGRMSVLAGFVEPGESAEHAVAREVFEETAITVGHIRYLGSQPWPMPRSLMLGFQAAAPGGQRITVDAEEIGEARWFTREEMLAAIGTGELAVAPTSSIARRLIEFWYGGGLPDGPGSWTAPAR
ncbi:MAG: NAD(+) diphosphatase [Trebonia sp.]|uniref:NAD(+) diphosphatase n=1 Tax=Trebonia sp. TaxID=2767075 RepID=UPI003BB1C99F